MTTAIYYDGGQDQGEHWALDFFKIVPVCHHLYRFLVLDNGEKLSNKVGCGANAHLGTMTKKLESWARTGTLVSIARKARENGGRR